MNDWDLVDMLIEDRIRERIEHEEKEQEQKS